jgi:hypothetical protein
MRRILLGLAILVMTIMVTEPALADDGCWFGSYGRIQCYPGARPGVPYYGGQSEYYERRRYHRGYEGYGEYGPPRDYGRPYRYWR